MQLAFLILSDLLLLSIFLQDIKFRAVSWVLFPLALLATGAGAFLAGMDWQEWAWSALFNLVFLALNTGLMILWFRIKKIPPRVLLKKHIGAGDFLFFLLMALALPFPAFPVLFIVSLLVSLVAGLLWFQKSTVPLAGLQSLFLAFFLTLEHFELLSIHHFNFLGP